MKRSYPFSIRLPQELLEKLELEKEKVLLQEDINAQDEQYLGDGLHNLIDDICHLEIDCGPNVTVRVTVERIESNAS